MSGEKRGVGIRLYVAGEEVVKRAFNGVADSGRKMWSEIAMGGKSANPAVVALSRTSQEAQGAVGGLAARAGGAARVLGAFGVAGVGVGAVLGGLVIGLNQARGAMDFADQVADQAAKLGVSTDALQEYQYALRMAGGEADQAGTAIEAFDKKFGAALGRYGKRDVKPFAALGFTQEDLDSFDSMEDALAATIDKIAALENASEQAAIADKLGLSAMLPLIREGAGGFERLANEAHALGLVMDESLIKRAAEAKDEFDTMAQVIDLQLKQAFVDLGPTLVDLMGLLAQLATMLSDVFDGFRSLEDKTMRGLQNRRNDLLTQAAQYMPNAMKGSAIAQADLDRVSNQLAQVEFLIDARARRAREDEGRRTSEGPRLVAQMPGGGGRSGKAKGKAELTPEEIAARRLVIDLEQRLAVARELGSKVTVQAIEDEKFLADQRKRYEDAKIDPDVAALRAGMDLRERQWARDNAANMEAMTAEPKDFTSAEKRYEELIKGVNDAMEWDAERRADWARNLGDATAAGLDAALNDDFWGWFKAQLYSSALDGFGRGVTEALSGSGGDGLFGFLGGLFGGGEGSGLTDGGDGGGGGWVSAGLSAIFGGNRAAGGGMSDGAWYRVAEHNRPELMMVGGGGYVSDPGATARMLNDMVEGQAGGRGRGGKMDVTIRSVLEIPAGYVPDAQMAQMFQAVHADAVAVAQQRAAENAPGAAIHYKFTKG